ncbi:MAG: pyridoxine 5'-phosphate synthase [Hyphomonas sp.]|uniref:pyridoxine 5'-phosphate synthase n=1 Tax=Hyphomonas sp. TaxID=87 RepID=UPI0034A0919E
MSDFLRLGVNIDHVATIRNARGGPHPDPVRAAEIAEAAGADGITIHLREDRRHIRDGDLEAIRRATRLPINLEMAVTEEMVAIATAFRPHAACLVPERREERTTEGGLDVAGMHNRIAPVVEALRRAGARVSLFIEPDPVQIAVAEVLGAPVVELHTGKYAELWLEGGADAAAPELERLKFAAADARRRGIEPHAGHGLTFENVGPVAAIAELAELNIGHFLVGEAVFIGLEASIREMRRRMDITRGAAAAA